MRKSSTSSRSAIPTRQRIVFFLCASVLVSFALMTPSSLASLIGGVRSFAGSLVRTNSLRPAAASPRTQQTRPGTCNSCPPPSPRRIYAPAIELNEAGACEIVLNSRSPNPIDVTPTFYTLSGNDIVGNTVTLQPAEIRFVNVEQLMPESLRRQRRWGGIALSYTGHVLEVWAQITFHGVSGGSIDETFNILEEPGSDTREAVWWMPQRSTAIIALGNTSDSLIHTTAQFSIGDSEDVDIPPFATKFIRRRAGQAADQSVKLTTVGPNGSLRVAGFIVADDQTFASSIRFYDTKKTVQPNLYATNLRLKNASPRIVLKNTSDAAVSASPRFFSASVEQGSPVELQPITLQPQQVVDLDLSSLIQAASSRTDLESVSVQISNSGAPGTLIGAAYSTQQATNLVYDVPLRDSGKVRNTTGSYPWRVDNDYSTIVTVTNVGNQPARFQVEIRYPGGPYSIKQWELALGETATFDLRKLRDEQTPDRTGKTLPLTLDRGQFHWSMVATQGDAHIVGRAEVVSPSGRVVSSYSCPVCCPDSGPYGRFDPNAYGLSVDGFVYTNAHGDYYDCYFNYYSGSVFFSQMFTYNTSVATINGGTWQLNGIAVGDTDVEGDYNYTEWWNDGMDCYPYYGGGGANAPVTVFNVVLDADVVDVQPSGTGGTNTATVKVTTSPPWPNQTVRLSLSAGSGDGGHVSHSGTRPLGTLAATQGTTNAQGVFQTTYTAPIFGGDVYVSGTLNNSPISRSVNMFVHVPGLDELGAAADYALVGTTTTHPRNHYGTATALTNLPLIASDYLNQFPGADILRYNDMSLIWGGKFDWQEANWCSDCAHAEHRIGINCDVFSGNVPTSRWSALTAIFRARHSPNFGDETASASHWHLRFDQ